MNHEKRRKKKKEKNATFSRGEKGQYVVIARSKERPIAGEEEEATLN